MMSSKTELVSFWEQFSDKESKNIKPIDFSLIDRFASFFSPSNFYYYVVNFPKFEIELVSGNYQIMTGLNPNTFSINQWLEAVHPEDIGFIHQCEKTIEKFFFEFLPIDKIQHYKVSYSYRMLNAASGEYFQTLHQTMALSMIDSGSIGHVLGVETNIGLITNNPRKSISFLDLNGQNHYLNIDVHNPVFRKSTRQLHPFTKQESTIIELISYGKSTEDIAQTLNVSVKTVKKHRENILSKSSAKNMTALISNLIRQGML